MMNRETTEHVADMLPAYLNGTLDAGTAARVEAHLPGCAACRAELAEWRAIAEAAPMLYRQSPIPADTLLSRVWSEVDRAEAETLRRRPALRLAWLWSLLIGQLPLVRRGIWTASALTMALGCIIELFRPYGVGEVLAVVAPVVAALGIAFVYGPENDPSLEIALATPTSPRLVLLGRLTLVYAYDILLAITASVAITAMRGGMGLWPVIVLWLGPMLFLSALSLVLSLLSGSVVGISTALVIWATRIMVGGHWLPTSQRDLFIRFWGSNTLLIPLAAALLLVAFVSVSWQGRSIVGNRHSHLPA
jgi:hypothetical protein